MSEHSLPDQILDAIPEIYEVNNYARTADWNNLGIQLQLNETSLAGCHECAAVYQLWLDEKGRHATRRMLLTALRDIRQNKVADNYVDYLKTIKMEVPVSDSTEPKITDPNTTNVSISAPYPDTTNFPVPVSTSTEPNTSSVQPPPGNPPHVPQHNPVFPHPNINPTVEGGGYPPNPYPQHYPPQPYQYPYPAPNPPYYQQPYANPYALQFNPYSYQTNPNLPYTPQTNPNLPYAPQTNPNLPYAPQTNPNLPYAPQTNPNLPYDLQTNPNLPYAPQTNPNLPYAPQTNLNLPYAPQTNPNLPYAPQTNPNLPYAPQINPNLPYAPQTNPHTPHLNPNTTNVPVSAPYQNITNVSASEPNPNTTNVSASEPNPNTTNVSASEPNPNVTPHPNVNTKVTDSITYKEFEEQAKFQYNDHRVGLVVIMGVVNKHGPQGTDIDVDRVKKTFQDLNFATWVIKDPTPDKVRQAVKIVTEYNFPLSFRGIIVYYAGHGGSYNEQGFFFLPCDEDKQEKFLIDSEVIAPFQPKNKECRLADRYRLFLFDCCLKEDANSKAIPTAQTVIEPDLNLPPYQPEVDYTLVAHAAYVREASKGKFWDGGVWTHYLCDNIKSYGSTKTIGAILNITREDVIKKTAGKVQAPFYKSMGGDVMLLQGTVPSTGPIIPIPIPPVVDAVTGSSNDDIDIEKIMNAIPEKSDLITVLDGIKDDVKKWCELFGKRLLKNAKKSDSWFRNFTELEFLIDEITGDNADDYIYTWGSVIDALDKPTPIKSGSNRAGFKLVSDVVRDELNLPYVYEKYKDQLNQLKKQ